MDYFNARMIGEQGPKGAESYLLKKKKCSHAKNVVAAQVVILIIKNTWKHKVLMVWWLNQRLLPVRPRFEPRQGHVENIDSGHFFETERAHRYK